MRKFIGILFGLVVIAVAAVLIGPSFVDWNKYTGEISRQVQDLTGRALAINGDIRIAVLPAPALVVGDIAFANADGAEPKNMATLKSAEVRVALGPLLGGIVQVETVKLIEPVLHLERLKDGRANWEFAVAKKPNGAAAPAEASGGAMPAIALDNLTVENATVIYRDAAAGVTERVEGLNARIAAVSLKGPLETQGSVTVRGIPLTFDVNVGELIHDRTVPFTLRLGAAAGALSAQLGGTLVNLTETPKFKGTIKLEGADLSAALAKAAGAAPSPTLAHAFSLTGEVTATAAAVEVQKLQTALGPVRANGDLRVDLGDKPTMSARLGIPKLDLNALLASPKATKADGAPAASPTPAAAPAPAEPLRLDLPKGIEASAILSVDAMPYRDGVIRDALVNATLAGGVLKVTQASAQFPGGSDLAAALSLHTPGGVPTFSAEVDSTINDLRGVFGWLGVGLPDIPADRLRKTGVRAKLSGTPEQVQIGDLDLRFDGSRLTGGVTVALRERLAFGANLNLDRLSVDAYMPKPASGAAQPAAGAANPFAALAALSGFDANLQAHVKSLVYQDNPIKDVVADVTLYNGGLDIRRLSVGEAAGALVSLKGKLLELGGVPKAEALQFETKIADLGRLARLAGAQLPAEARAVSAVSAKGRIDGALLRPSVDASASLAGGVVGIKGRLSALPTSDMIDARLTLRHNDVAGLVRRMNLDYKPADPVGGIDLAADVKASLAEVSVANLQLTLGKTTIRGQTKVSLAGPKPAVVANLTAGGLVVDPFLPAPAKPARRTSTPSRGAGGGTSTSGGGSGGSPFPDDPLDLSALSAFDADVQMKAALFAYDKILVDNLDVAATVKNGVLTVSRLNGKMFDGQLNAVAEAATGTANRLAFKGKIAGVDVAKSLTAVTGEALANGRMGIEMDVAGAGRSVHDVVGTLAGTSSVALTEVDVQKAGKGTMMAGLLGLMTSLNSLGGGKTRDQAQMTGSFQIARGVAQSNDIKLQSAFGNGTAAGLVDLPAWTIDIKGQVELAQSLVTRLLQAKIRESRNAVSFAISGPIDAPDVNVDTGALLGAGVPIPGADALLNKAPKGVGNILRGILGGGQPQQPATQPLPTPPPQSGQQQQQQQQQQQLTPEKLLKNLFKL